MVMDEPCSYSWRGPPGCGKRTQLLAFLEQRAQRNHLPFEIKHDTWYLNKQTNGGDPNESDDETAGKSIQYEESALHLGFDVEHFSMSDKIFVNSVLSRWSGQNDLTLIGHNIQTRYLVLYHAHFLTDESVLQLQECLEQYPSFAILLTTNFPLCGRLRDHCFEIPVAGPDHLLANYTKRANLTEKDVWMESFKKTLNEWSINETPKRISEVRTWIYMCLQRNLRWTNVITYWIQAIYQTEWITPKMRAELLNILWHAESGAGWVLVTSYRIPILWEHVHLKLARQLFRLRSASLAQS
jgi:hypothetical protein